MTGGTKFKTWLIISVVLISMGGVASVANATLLLYVDGEPAGRGVARRIYSSSTISVYSDDTLPWAGYIILDDFVYMEQGALANPTALPAAGSVGDIEPYTINGMGSGYKVTTDGFGIQPGIQHSADFVSIGPGVSFISLWDDDLGFDAPIDYFSIWHASGPSGDFQTAEADGPYQIGPGETRTLSGRYTLSSDIPEMRWSIGGEYIGDAEMLAVSYDTLVNDIGLGLGVHEVELRVSSSIGIDYDYTTITIIPEPATLLLLALGGVGLLRKRRCGEIHLNERNYPNEEKSGLL
ncbi:MAG: PEP-CTERM sorting domain-containing protein [Planctomycetota bacterium]|jgi:hypothetical protein